jgi:predicted dehydrogenase
VTERRRLRAAVVGAGLMGRWHARALRHANGGAELVAVVDSDRARAASLAGEHGARATTSLAEAIAATSIDVVHICTPLETHRAITLDAVAHGMHVLVEKPLVDSTGETEEILRAAAGRGLLVCPVHQFPMQRGVRRVIAALPRIGPVLHVEATACSAGAQDGRDDARDRVAADILPHPLSLFAAVLDAPLADVSWSAHHPRAGELLATGTVDATTLAIVVSMAGRPTTNSLRVIGARGTAHVDLFHGFAVIEGGGVSRARKILHPFALAAATSVAALANLSRRAMATESAYPGLRELVGAFYAAARGERPPPIAPGRVLDVARARDAILRHMS